MNGKSPSVSQGVWSNPWSRTRSMTYLWWFFVKTMRIDYLLGGWGTTLWLWLDIVAELDMGRSSVERPIDHWPPGSFRDGLFIICFGIVRTCAPTQIVRGNACAARTIWPLTSIFSYIQARASLYVRQCAAHVRTDGPQNAHCSLTRLQKNESTSLQISPYWRRLSDNTS